MASTLKIPISVRILVKSLIDEMKVLLEKSSSLKWLSAHFFPIVSMPTGTIVYPKGCRKAWPPLPLSPFLLSLSLSILSSLLLIYLSFSLSLPISLSLSLSVFCLFVFIFLYFLLFLYFSFPMYYSFSLYLSIIMCEFFLSLFLYL
jgi:hypothetical protein